MFNTLVDINEFRHVGRYLHDLHDLTIFKNDKGIVNLLLLKKILAVSDELFEKPSKISSV